MTFDDLPTGSTVFVDANVFVYAFAPDPVLGPPSIRLLERIELRDLAGFSSSHVLSDVAHRLMSLEACAAYGWPINGIVRRLRRHPAEVAKLYRYAQAIDEIVAMGVQVVAVTASSIRVATSMSRQHGLLTNDALIVALMHEHGLTNLASNDTDFDRVPGIVRYAPV